MVTVDQYRKILRDKKSTDEQIQERLNYLEAFCKNIIKGELEKYLAQARAVKKKKL